MKKTRTRTVKKTEIYYICDGCGKEFQEGSVCRICGKDFCLGKCYDKGEYVVKSKHGYFFCSHCLKGNKKTFEEFCFSDSQRLDSHIVRTSIIKKWKSNMEI